MSAAEIERRGLEVVGGVVVAWSGASLGFAVDARSHVRKPPSSRMFWTLRTRVSR